MRLEPGEGRDQHEQRRARQVEIGHQHIDGPEAIAGRDEDVGLARERRRAMPSAPAALSSSRSDVVPTATMRPPARARGIERRGRLGGDLAPFGVHAVLGRVVGLHRQEGAGADVQRHEVPGDAARLQRAQTAPA